MSGDSFLRVFFQTRGKRLSYPASTRRVKTLVSLRGFVLTRYHFGFNHSLRSRGSCRLGAFEHLPEMREQSLAQVRSDDPRSAGDQDPFHGRCRSFHAISYHSIVLRSPSSKGVRAMKPNSSLAREVSRQRRGWPSGLLRSRTTFPR